ncbi:GNAT family N-acetyltransferase [Pseudaestuariivita sp.]|uniref:GNAT family N-acetyltransferase n=1 Tax=Pseudaestuariivita sp. TaxID=2211669 RepID=UPI004058CDE6
MSVTVHRDSPKEAGSLALLQESHALMQSLFSEDENHFLSVDELCAPSVHFFTARDADGTALGCGALAVKDGYGEIKSMYVATRARGKGVAAALLSEIEDEARRQALPMLRLETGDVLYDAHRLYGRHGFSIRGPFGEYTESPASLFMEKPLV